MTERKNSMRTPTGTFISTLAILASYLLACSIVFADDTTKTSDGDRAQAQAKANPQIEKQRQEAEQQASKALDKDAQAAIDETNKAIKAISDGKTSDAIAALERATGKINILVGRNPANALIPVQLNAQVIDVAPTDLKAIKTIAKAADSAVDDKDYPAARVLLQGLVSEIRVRMANLPLATYPIAMQDAARLLDQKKTEEAKAVLQTALNTLVVIDHVTPLPIAVAQEAIKDAEAKRDSNKDEAQKLLATAKSELERAKELGYAGKDPEYAALSNEISNVEKALSGNGDSRSAFARLKDRVSSFFHRQSASEKRSEVASTR
jgi:hypothetical protein